MPAELAPIIAALLVTLSVVLAFIGLWKLGNTTDPIENRLREYGASEVRQDPPTEGARKGKGSGWLNKRLARKSVGMRVADSLAQADLPLTVVEYILIILGIAGLLGAVGFWRGGLMLAGPAAVAGLFLPQFYLRMRAGKRRQAFNAQLPDVLTLLVGALRAGYGMMQAMDMLIDRLPKPASIEFSRAMRAVNLGQPLTRALGDMADRVASDDLYLVVTAMSVQQELGGNLSQILETITGTIKERIKIKREIQVFTSQQRMTGYMLAGLPVAVVVILSFINRDYIMQLFQPGIMRFVLGTAIMMQVLGFIAIQRIVRIEV